MTSDECHVWFHLNAANPAAGNTEQLNITKNLVHGRIRNNNTAQPPDYKSTVITARLQLAWYEMELNVHEIYIIQSVNKLEKVHVYIASTMCRLSFILPYNVWILLNTVITYIYPRTLKTPVTYRLYGEQNSVKNNSKFRNLCDKCIYIDVY